MQRLLANEGHLAARSYFIDNLPRWSFNEDGLGLLERRHVALRNAHHLLRTASLIDGMRLHCSLSVCVATKRHGLGLGDVALLGRLLDHT